MQLLTYSSVLHQLRYSEDMVPEVLPKDDCAINMSA